MRGLVFGSVLVYLDFTGAGSRGRTGFVQLDGGVILLPASLPHFVLFAAGFSQLDIGVILSGCALSVLLRNLLDGGVIFAGGAFSSLLLVFHACNVLVRSFVRSYLFGDHVLVGLLLAAGLAHIDLRIGFASGVLRVGFC